MAANARGQADFQMSFSSPRGATSRLCPIDLVHLARQTMDDSALESELLALFDRQAGQIAAVLESPVAAGENISRDDLAHKLKGSARAVGAFAVAAAAENYEHAARAGLLRASDAAAISEAVADVRAALKALGN